jgi:hypothetical protein
MVILTVRVKGKILAARAGQSGGNCYIRCGSRERKPHRAAISKETEMARHKKHERKKELDRRRQRRKKAIKARIREAKAEAKA